MRPQEWQALRPAVVAPWISAMDMELLECQLGSVRIRLPVRQEFMHVGQMMCGQAVMAAADTAMVLALINELGEFRPLTTAQLQTSFLRPIAGDHCIVTAKILRRGRKLAFGSSDIANPDGRLAAQATSTLTLL